MAAEGKSKFTLMTTEPVERLVFKMAVPTIISMLVTALYNIVDTFFVGRIGNEATAGVGLVLPMMAVMHAFGFFFGMGSGNYISRALGRHETEDAERMAAVGFFSALGGGSVIMVFGLLFLRPLARWLGSTETILPYAVSYMRLILIGAPYMTASLVLNNQLRFQGNAFYSMIGLVSGAVLNIALDPLLIFVFDMGIAGAALATILSQFVSFVLLWIGVQRSGSLSIRAKNFRPSKALFSLFCLYVTLFANFMEQVRLSSFLGCVIVIGFLYYPARKGHSREPSTTAILSKQAICPRRTESG